MLNLEKFPHDRMKLQKGAYPARDKVIEAATNAHRVFTLRIHLNCDPNNKKARENLDLLLARTDTELRHWEQPYEQRRVLERKGGVKNYV